VEGIPKESCSSFKENPETYITISIVRDINQNAGQNYDIKVSNRCFENVANFKYLGTTITNQNMIQKEIKRRLNSGNASYHSLQNFLSLLVCCLKNIKIGIYKTIILPVVLYGREIGL
jgi:hypothetical protein